MHAARSIKTYFGIKGADARRAPEGETDNFAGNGTDARRAKVRKPQHTNVCEDFRTECNVAGVPFPVKLMFEVTHTSE